MDLSTMTFEEILFHGRYHIIGGILFLIFFAVFVQEAIRELLAYRARRRSIVREVAFGPMMHDVVVGPVMTDGGEPVDKAENQDEPEEK